ncbi:MAG: flagellar motor switch protein FliG [Alphaproteobacteria bacterium]|nr:flagellar motor switch protein FliG [Alphaproteobacteria bacterium]
MAKLQKKEPSPEKKGSFSGTERAAIIVLSLSHERASALFKLMSTEEIRQISQAMITLGKVKGGNVEEVYLGFIEEMPSADTLIGSLENTEKLLLESLGQEKADMIMDEVRGPSGRTLWDKLANVNEEVLANYLKGEYPQTVAVILSKIKPTNAAKVLDLLPEELSCEVCYRLLKMGTVHKEFLKELEEVLQQDFMQNLVRSSGRNNYESVAEIFNHLDRGTEKRLLEGIEKLDLGASEHIKALLFTFDDVMKLDSVAVRVLLSNVDKRKLAIAMKGLVENQRELFYRNMSERARKLLADDISQMGPVRVRDVEEAQSYIVMITKDLAANETIMLIDPRDSKTKLIG